MDPVLSMPLDSALTLRAAGRAVEAALDRTLGRHGLTLARYELLEALVAGGAGGVAIADMARQVNIHRSSAGQGLSILEGQGLAHRSSDPQDRRRVLFRPSDGGRQRLLAARATLGLP